MLGTISAVKRSLLLWLKEASLHKQLLYRHSASCFSSRARAGSANFARPEDTGVQSDESDAQRAVREAQEELADLRREALPGQRKRGQQTQRKRQADSPDPISSTLTRRFGLAGGLAWLGFLSFGVVSEQVKTRLENASEREGTKDVSDAREVSLGEGLKYQDVREGGGQPVQQGFLTVLHYKGFADSNPVPFEDTKKRGKPIVYLFGSRPFTAGLCLGVEKGMQGMKAGGIRKVTVPPSLAFGDKGISLRGTTHAPDKAADAEVPPNATLTYELELVRVSIAPS